MQVFRITLLLSVSALAAAQSTIPSKTPWKMQESGTTAGLRGIDSVDGMVAWASGSGGTVLKTIDGGAHWTQCAVPDAAKDGATLDFRGVQAFDAKTAFVMSSGKGKISRIYKTADGCKTWKYSNINDYPDGFYDAFRFWDRKHGFIIGDPMMQSVFSGCAYREDCIKEKAELSPGLAEYNGPWRRFLMRYTIDGGKGWSQSFLSPGSALGVDADIDEGEAFAASNSSLFMPFQVPSQCWPYPTIASDRAWIGFGGQGGARVLLGKNPARIACKSTVPKRRLKKGVIDSTELVWSKIVPVPLAGGTESSGIFSIAFRQESNQVRITGVIKNFPNADTYGYLNGVAVGGDYTKPAEGKGTAAWSADGGNHWTASTTPPHGFRSAVQWSETLKLWITVGTNGSDVSRDDGKTWQPLDNGNWNALSLPFVVGPNGRIARLNPAALP